MLLLAKHSRFLNRYIVFINLTRRCGKAYSLGYSLHTGGGCSGNLLFADWDDLENNIASEVHVNKFRSREV